MLFHLNQPTQLLTAKCEQGLMSLLDNHTQNILTCADKLAHYHSALNQDS